MDIKVLASGSSGNAYIVGDGFSSVLIECGIPMDQMQKKSNFQVLSVSGCLISHEHKDHCKAVKEVIKRGIDVYASKGTIEKMGVKGHRVHAVKPFLGAEIGSFVVSPFDVEHDADDPLGFVIYSKEKHEGLLYFTDTYYVRYRFPYIHYLMAEANYDIDIVNENIKSGDPGGSRKNRVIESHMSIANLENFIREMDTKFLKQVYLLHMSKENADPEAFKERIQKLTGAEVYIC